MIDHKQLLEKYSYNISVITGLERGIAIIQNEINDDWHESDLSLDFYELQERHDEVQTMQNRLVNLREKLDDSINAEYNGVWYADAELYKFFLNSLGKCDPYTVLYKKRIETYYGPKQSRKSVQYSKWRRRVLMRDGAACRICGETAPLEVHHLFSWEYYPRYRMVKENGVVLCVPCHKEFHLNYMGGSEIPCTIFDYIDFAHSMF